MRIAGTTTSPGPGSVAGLLAGAILGTMSITLVFLGMRAVMAIGGACADGGPYVPVRPCPDGVPLAMVGGIFGMFGAAGLLIWFGSRFGPRWAGLPLLGWPALFLSLGWNFLEFGLNPPGGGGWEWGWLICGVVFWLMGGLPLAGGILALRAGSASPASPRAIARAAVFRPEIRPAPRPGPSDDLVGALERLAQLHRAGQLSDAEFEAAKRRLLSGEGQP